MSEPRTLKIGTFISRETNLEKLQSVECKHFRSLHPGQTVICASGAEITFVDGTFSTCDEEAIEACSNAAKSRISGIFFLDDESIQGIIASAKRQQVEIAEAAATATKLAGDAPVAN